MNSNTHTKKRNIIVAWVLVLAMVIPLFLSAVTSFAATTGANPYDTLILRCKSAEMPSTMGTAEKKIKEKRFKKSGGGYYLYTEITNIANDNSAQNLLDENKYLELTAGGKKDFLQNYISIAYAWEQFYKEQKSSNTAEYITNETVTDMFQELQQVSGAGSQMMAALLNDTKPDYATANRLYKPFSGIVGTVLGVISILIMALLGITMALDIAYIVIPMFQLFLDGDGDGGGGKGRSGMAKIISQEAVSAVQSAEGGGGAGGQSGNKKLAISQYFKVRWKSLLVLGICLLYLVQGQIYSFVSWIIDLVSGFLGF